jgi:hypothetical protein
MQVYCIKIVGPVSPPRAGGSFEIHKIARLTFGVPLAGMRQAMIENPRLETPEEAVIETARLGFLEKVPMHNVSIMERVNFARGFASEGSIKQNQS